MRRTKGTYRGCEVTAKNLSPDCVELTITREGIEVERRLKITADTNRLNHDMALKLAVSYIDELLGENNENN